MKWANRCFTHGFAMLRNANSVGFSDGLNYVDDCTEITLYKDVFKLIFEALEQEQHYKMMMGEEAL